MKVLCKTDQLQLVYEYETARLIEKSTGKVLLEESFYGDPSCGLIGAENDWAIIAGEHLTIWRRDRSASIRHDELHSIHTMRIKDNRTVEILTDPWSETSAIWVVDVVTFEYGKVKGFTVYKNRTYSDSVEW